MYLVTVLSCSSENDLEVTEVVQIIEDTEVSLCVYKSSVLAQTKLPKQAKADQSKQKKEKQAKADKSRPKQTKADQSRPKQAKADQSK